MSPSNAETKGTPDERMLVMSLTKRIRRIFDITLMCYRAPSTLPYIHTYISLIQDTTATSILIWSMADHMPFQSQFWKDNCRVWRHPYIRSDLRGVLQTVPEVECTLNSRYMYMQVTLVNHVQKAWADWNALDLHYPSKLEISKSLSWLYVIVSCIKPHRARCFSPWQDCCHKIS